MREGDGQPGNGVEDVSRVFESKEKRGVSEEGVESVEAEGDKGASVSVSGNSWQCSGSSLFGDAIELFDFTDAEQLLFVQRQLIYPVTRALTFLNVNVFISMGGFSLVVFITSFINLHRYKKNIFIYLEVCYFN